MVGDDNLEMGLKLYENQHCQLSLPLSPWEWILQNVKTLDATGGIKPFPDYPFASRLVEGLLDHRILIVAKSRQMMATWTVAATTLYRALFETPGIYLFLSKGARDSKELVKRLKIMVTNLPSDLRDQIKIKAEEVTFANESRIISLPATEFAPRMYSPSGVFWDEMAFTPKSEGIWTSLKPAIDSGGSFVGISTPNGCDNIFHQLFIDKSNGFGKLKLHYDEHPLRGEAWQAEARKGLSVARWKQEYEIDFSILADRVFDEFDPEKHIIHEKFDPVQVEGRIYRGIDFGYRHPYVVWVHQAISGELTLFDELEGSDLTVDELADEIKRVDARNGITESDVKLSACDPAGASATDSGLSAVERLGRIGIKLIHRPSEINTGVDLLKSQLLDAAGVVRLRFTANCQQTIEHLRHYRWGKDGEKPVKGEGHDHAVDALRYLVVNLKGRKPAGWSGAKVMGVGR